MAEPDRKFDIALIKSARDAARAIHNRSAKFALIFNQLADRLEALSSAAPTEHKQPASAPDQTGGEIDGSQR